VSSGIVIDEGFPLTINNVSFEKLVVYVLCALMKAFGLFGPVSFFTTLQH
jgi:hypothetical protein